MTPPSLNHGTRHEIAVDNKPRTYCDLRTIAIRIAEGMKTRNPNAKVTVRDLDTDEVIVIDSPFET